MNNLILFLGKNIRTILEDALNVESVGGARFVVGAASEIGRQLAGAGFVDDARTGIADSICSIDKYKMINPRGSEK